MKKLFIGIAVISIAFFSSNAFAKITISGNAPSITSSNPIINGALSTFNNDISKVFDDTLGSVQSELDKFSDQDKLARGFANATAYSSKSAAMWGYQGYSLFAIMAGISLGAQLPISLSLDPSAMLSELDEVGSKIEEDGDVLVGLSPSLSINVGLRIGALLPILPRDLYANIKWFSYSYSFDGNGNNLKFSTNNFAIAANYQLVKGFSPVLGLIKWRGVSVSSGLYFQSNTVELTVDIPEQRSETPVDSNASGFNLQGDMVIDPDVRMKIDLFSMTIPAEIVTSFRLLWILNLYVGLGLDFNFGLSTLELSSGAKVLFDPTINGAPVSNTGTTVTDGNVRIAAKNEQSPDFVTPRFMFGLGLNLGPVVAVNLDAVYYFANKGVSLGLGFGLVW